MVDRSNGNRGFRRWSVYAGVTSTLAVAALMVLVPVSAATTAGVTYRAPFKTLPESSSYGVSNAGCATGKTTKAPKWDAHLGTFKIAGGAQAPPCKVSTNGNSYADWDGSWNTQGGFYFSHNGSNIVNFTWKLRAAASWALSNYTCKLNFNAALSECYEWADVFVEVGYQVFDETNFTQFNGAYTTIFSGSGGSENFSQRVCSGGTCSVSSTNSSFGPSGNVSGTYSGSTQATMSGGYAVANDSNEYDYYFVILGIAIVYAYTINAKSVGPVGATADINMGSGGDEFLLQTFTIS